MAVDAMQRNRRRKRARASLDYMRRFWIVLVRVARKRNCPDTESLPGQSVKEHMTIVTRVTEKQKRSVPCPKCGAKRNRPCRGARIPGANTFGGGRGGPPDLERSHDERRTALMTGPTEPAPATDASRATLSFPVLTVPSFEGES